MDLDVSDERWAEYRACIFRAADMVAEQAAVSVVAALGMLCDHAAINGVSLIGFGQDVVERRIGFDPVVL